MSRSIRFAPRGPVSGHTPQHRRRSYATLAFRLGDVSAQTLSLKMVTVLKPFRPPTKQQLTAESNEEVRRIACTYDADHGTSVGLPYLQSIEPSVGSVPWVVRY